MGVVPWQIVAFLGFLAYDVAGLLADAVLVGVPVQDS